MSQTRRPAPRRLSLLTDHKAFALSLGLPADYYVWTGGYDGAGPTGEVIINPEYQSETQRTLADQYERMSKGGCIWQILQPARKNLERVQLADEEELRARLAQEETDR